MLHKMPRFNQKRNIKLKKQLPTGTQMTYIKPKKRDIILNKLEEIDARISNFMGLRQHLFI